jgi:hypothetical protein
MSGGSTVGVKEGITAEKGVGESGTAVTGVEQAARAPAKKITQKSLFQRLIIIVYSSHPQTIIP